MNGSASPQRIEVITCWISKKLLKQHITLCTVYTVVTKLFTRPPKDHVQNISDPRTRRGYIKENW